MDEPIVNPNQKIDDIRAKVKGIGWRLREYPVKSGDTIASWTLTASKPGSPVPTTVTIHSLGLEEGMVNLGKYLGLIPKNS